MNPEFRPTFSAALTKMIDQWYRFCVPPDIIFVSFREWMRGHRSRQDRTGQRRYYPRVSSTRAASTAPAPAARTP